MTGHEMLAPADRGCGHHLQRQGLAVGRWQRLQRDVEATVGRQQRRDRYAARSQQRHPGAVGPQTRPAAAPQGQQQCPGTHPDRAGGCVEAQDLAVGGPARPAVAHVKLHRRPARRRVPQTLQPGAQQRRGFHVGGKHPARAADKGLDTQPRRPGSHLGGAELAQQCLDLPATGTIALGKTVGRFRMGQIHAALAREQELAAHRRHGVEQVHRHAGGREHLGGHQAGRATAHNGHRHLQIGRQVGRMVGCSGHGKGFGSAGISMSCPSGLRKARRTGSPGCA